MIYNEFITKSTSKFVPQFWANEDYIKLSYVWDRFLKFVL